MKKKQVTVTSSWLNETFVGTEKEVSKYLLNLKQRQFSILNEQTQKQYRYAHSSHGKEHDVLEIREKINSQHPDIGLKITITTVN